MFGVLDEMRAQVLLATPCAFRDDLLGLAMSHFTSGSHMESTPIEGSDQPYMQTGLQILRDQDVYKRQWWG